MASQLGAARRSYVPLLEKSIDADLLFDPLRIKSAEFLNILQRLDDLTFGAKGLLMPRWVFYDCAEVPGGIFGFARPAAEVPEWTRRALNVDPTYEGMIPLSMYVGIPMLEPGAWLTYTLASLNAVAPGAGPAGLLLLTEVAGLDLFEIETCWGVSQWRSPKLEARLATGPLELITAWTPGHSDPHTLTYRFTVTQEKLEMALTERPPPLPDDVQWVDCDEEAELRALQSKLEEGRHFELVGIPVSDGSYTRAPVREVRSE